MESSPRKSSLLANCLFSIRRSNFHFVWHEVRIGGIDIGDAETAVTAATAAAATRGQQQLLQGQQQQGQ